MAFSSSEPGQRIGKAQAMHDGQRGGSDRTLIEFCQRGMGVREFDIVAGRFGRRQRSTRRRQRRMPAENIVERGLIDSLDILRHMSDATDRRRLDIALFGGQIAEHRGKQRGLAAAVGANQPDALARCSDQRGAAIERLGTSRQRDIDQSKHLIGQPRRRPRAEVR